MAFLHRYRNAEKQALNDTKEYNILFAKQKAAQSIPLSTSETESDQMAQTVLDSKLAKLDINYKEKKPVAKMYDGVREDIKKMGTKATFGDVLELLRKGPASSSTAGLTPTQKKQNAKDVLQGIRSLKSMVDRENANIGPVAALLQQLMLGSGGGGDENSSLPNLMQEGIHGSDNVLPENGYAQRVQVKQQNGSMKRKTNDGSFGIPDGAVIRSKGYSELWTARRRSKELKDTDLDVERKKETGQNVRTSINCLSVQRSKDRSHVIVGTGCGDVRVVDLGTSRTVPNIEKGETLAQLSEIVEPLLLEGHEGYVSSAIGVGQLCFTGSLDASIRGWKYGSMEEVVKSNGHKSAVHDICYSCSKRCIYSASSDGTVRVWDLAKGKSNILCEHFECACYSIAISEKRGGQLFVGLDSGSIGVIDAVSGAVISDLKGHSSMVASLCFSPNSDLLVSGSSDGKCRIYFAGTSIVHYQHHDCPVYAVAFVQNGKCVVSGGTDGAIHRWSSATGVCQSVYRHFDQDTIFDLAFHAGKLLVGGRDGVLRCWEPSTSCEFCEQICGKNSSSDGCDWEKVECTNSCGIICYRFELALHLNQCINRKLRCSNPGCREVMMFKDLEKHQKDICPCARVKCPNSKINGGWGCDEVMRRRNLATHLIECYDPKLKGLKKKEEKNDGNRLSSSTIDRAPSPGMKGRKAKLNLPSMNKSTKGSRMKGSGVRVRIPLRSSAAGRKFQREQLNNRQKGSK